MIFYATKKTFKEYGLKPIKKLDGEYKREFEQIIEKETGKSLFEWGMKSFDVDGRKSLAIVNFASKFTVFLIDFKVDMLENIYHAVVFYMMKIYEDDKNMTENLLLKYLEESESLVFAPLKDKRMISYVNHVVSDFALDGDMFCRYINDSIMNTVQINRDVNYKYPVSDIVDGERIFIFGGKRFKEMLEEKYMNWYELILNP